MTLAVTSEVWRLYWHPAVATQGRRYWSLDKRNILSFLCPGMPAQVRQGPVTTATPHISLTSARSRAGVLMWEVYSEGRLPYDNRTNAEVAEALSKGLRLLKPRLAPDAVYLLMEWCWKEVCSRRWRAYSFIGPHIFSCALSPTETRGAPLLRPPAARTGLHLLTAPAAARFADPKLSHIYLIYWAFAPWND